MKKLFFALFFLFIALQTAQLQAQVTIGSSEAPVSGALLDLKEYNDAISLAGGRTATKGLGLPRVSLSTLDKLYPMFLKTDGTENEEYDTPSEQATQNDNHIGLVVYNVNQCIKNKEGIAIGAGIFIWDGTSWLATNELDQVFYKQQSETAANSNRNDWYSAWGNKVIRHEAKVGIYEEFVSADFGNAGRWMTTNLAARAYDGVGHSGGGTLSGPKTADNYTRVYWAYASSDMLNDTEFKANKHLGYLYTWSAATAGKGGSAGIQDVGNEGGISHTARQGICPKGWHLPSDYEWTELENVIIANSSQYSNIANIGGASLPQDNTTKEYRGTLHGKAMKDPCSPKTNMNPDGASKHVSLGGFSALLTGYTSHTTNSHQGLYSAFWSNSGYDPQLAWSREVTNAESRLNKATNRRFIMISVRCKKD